MPCHVSVQSVVANSWPLLHGSGVSWLAPPIWATAGYIPPRNKKNATSSAAALGIDLPAFHHSIRRLWSLKGCRQSERFVMEHLPSLPVPCGIYNFPANSGTTKIFSYEEFGVYRKYGSAVQMHTLIYCL